MLSYRISLVLRRPAGAGVWAWRSRCIYIYIYICILCCVAPPKHGRDLNHASVPTASYVVNCSDKISSSTAPAPDWLMPGMGVDVSSGNIIR